MGKTADILVKHTCAIIVGDVTNSMAKILLVEDDHMTNEFIAEYLSDAGHTILPAFNGADALKCFQQGGMELVILDIMLPGLI